MRRRPEPEPVEVDFVLDAVEPGRDEDLPQPPDVGRSWRSRLQLAAAGLAGLGLLVALVVRGIATHQPTHHVASPSLTLAVPAPAYSGPGIIVRDAPPNDYTTCPLTERGTSTCTTEHHVGATILAAIRQRLPGAAIGTQFERRLADLGYGSGGLWYRSVDAHLGRTEVSVVVRTRRDSDEVFTDVEHSGSRTSVVSQYIRDAYTVRVEAIGSSARQPQVAAVRALAADRRLID